MGDVRRRRRKTLIRPCSHRERKGSTGAVQINEVLGGAVAAVATLGISVDSSIV